MIEYLPWYSPDTSLVRCLSCGAMLSNGDIELHTGHHERNDRAADLSS